MGLYLIGGKLGPPLVSHGNGPASGWTSTSSFELLADFRARADAFLRLFL